MDNLYHKYYHLNSDECHQYHKLRGHQLQCRNSTHQRGINPRNFESAFQMCETSFELFQFYIRHSPTRIVSSCMVAPAINRIVRTTFPKDSMLSSSCDWTWSKQNQKIYENIKTGWDTVVFLFNEATFKSKSYATAAACIWNFELTPDLFLDPT